jgi:hypothetical protein
MEMAMTKTTFGVTKVGASHGWSWFYGDYNHGRVYPTKREATQALETHIADSKLSAIQILEKRSSTTTLANPSHSIVVMHPSSAEPVLLVHNTNGIIGEYPTKQIGIQAAIDALAAEMLR